jgi:hypothetical protein
MERYGTGEAYGEDVFGDLEQYYDAADLHAVKLHYKREHLAIAEETIEAMDGEYRDMQAHYETLKSELKELERASA